MPILIQAASSSSGQVDKGLTRGLHQNLQASTSLRTLSFYSWEKSSKRSNRKQSPIGKCVRLRRAEGIGLSPAYLISLHSSLDCTPVLMPPFLFTLTALCEVDAAAGVAGQHIGVHFL